MTVAVHNKNIYSAFFHKYLYTNSGRFVCMNLNRRGESEFITKHLIYLILIGAGIIAIWLIVNGIINKVLTLY